VEEEEEEGWILTRWSISLSPWVHAVGQWW